MSTHTRFSTRNCWRHTTSWKHSLGVWKVMKEITH